MTGVKAKSTLEHLVLSQHRAATNTIKNGSYSILHRAAALQACHGPCQHSLRSTGTPLVSNSQDGLVAIVFPRSCAEKILPLRNAEFLHPFHGALTPLQEQREKLNSRNATEGHGATNCTLQDLRRDCLRVVQKETIRHKLREVSFFHSLSRSPLKQLWKEC